MLLYYITDRRSLRGTAAQQRSGVLRLIGEACRAGVNYIQLREKDLTPRELERLGRDAMRVVRDHSAMTQLLVNARSDVALASAADGVHLPAGELAASEIRALWRQASSREPIIGVSAHTVAEVRQAEAEGADFVVLAPIFEKLHSSTPAIGLDALRAACTGFQPAESQASRLAVFALGGVTLSNAAACRAAGAAGVAGIRIFQADNLGETVRQLRQIEIALAGRL